MGARDLESVALEKWMRPSRSGTPAGSPAVQCTLLKLASHVDDQWKLPGSRFKARAIFVRSEWTEPSLSTRRP